MLPPEALDLTALVLELYGAPSAGATQQRLAEMGGQFCEYQVLLVHQRFVALRNSNCMVLCFHGSEAAADPLGNRPSDRTLADWQNNISMCLVPASSIIHNLRGRVHSGFAQCFKELVAHLDSLVPQMSHVQTVWLAGHSLGGALALLCALHMATAHTSVAPRVRVHTLGSPRIGDREVNQQLVGAVGSVCNVQMMLDPVIASPPLMLGYSENYGERCSLGGSLARQHGGLLGNLINTACGLLEHRISTYYRALQIASGEKNILYRIEDKEPPELSDASSDEGQADSFDVPC